jgi:prepilin-type N-terminal cleavage/methylation domain-containing protein
MSTSKSPRARLGFTLIELMITIGIIAIVMGLGVPTLVRMFHKEPLRQATTDIIEVAANARAMAILRGEMTELRFNPSERSISAGGGGGGSGEGKTLRDRNSAQWSESISLEMLDVNFLEHKNAEYARVRFFPNGTCDELTVILKNDQNEYRMLSWEITTGLASIETDPNRFASR